MDTLRFALLGMITTPPNFLWQEFLEKKFPSLKSTISTSSSPKQTANEKKETRLSKTNTVAKFFLDQTIGCWINTLGFLLLIGLLKEKSVVDIESEVRNVSIHCYIVALRTKADETFRRGSGRWCYLRIGFGQ